MSTYESTLANRAAMFYLMYIGKRATQKQIAELVKRMGETIVLKLARERGFQE